jgi:hypothetical protein
METYTRSTVEMPRLDLPEDSPSASLLDLDLEFSRDFPSQWAGILRHDHSIATGRYL